jgi:hypothetical protein
MDVETTKVHRVWREKEEKKKRRNMMMRKQTRRPLAIFGVSALLTALAAVAGVGSSPAYAIPNCDVPKPPPICTGGEEPPPPKPQPPPNDAFSGAYGLGVPGLQTGSTTLETGEPHPYSPNHPTRDCGIYGISNSVWYKVTAPNSYITQLKLSTRGSNFDTVLAVYEGSSLGTLRPVDCFNFNNEPNWTDSEIVDLYGGRTYYVQLSGTGGARSGAYVLRADWGCFYSAPDNANCPI